MSVYTSAGGSAIVGDATVVTMTYKLEGVAIKPIAASTTTKVYVPLTNPSVTTDTLQQIAIECSGTSSAKVNQAWVYFGNSKILNSSVSTADNGYTIAVASDNQKADSKPYGINVTLEINLPTTDSVLSIYSVTLTFNTPSS